MDLIHLIGFKEYFKTTGGTEKGGTINLQLQIAYSNFKKVLGHLTKENKLIGLDGNTTQ